MYCTVADTEIVSIRERVLSFETFFTHSCSITMLGEGQSVFSMQYKEFDFDFSQCYNKKAGEEM